MSRLVRLLRVADLRPTLPLIVEGRNYVVIARSYDHFKAWARRFAVSTVGMRYVHDQDSARGHSDYALILIPGSLLPDDEIILLIERATIICDVSKMYPVAELGKILRWVEYKKKEDDGA